MKVILPKITIIKPNSIWHSRKTIKAIFLRQHDLDVNLDSVQMESKEVTDLNAQNWLFLIEGHKRYFARENVYMDRFIEELSINAEDPVKSPFSPEVIKEASMEKAVAALAFLTMDYLDQIDRNNIEKLSNAEVKELFSICLNSVAKAFGVSAKELLLMFKRLRWQNEEILKKELRGLHQKRKELIRVSNTQSKSILTEILNKHRHPDLLIMSGIEHATIFTQ